MSIRCTGANSGLWLFSPDVPVQVGDAVEVTGAVIENFDRTQISTPATVILSQGNALPAAEMLTTADAGAEQWEGVLVQVTGVVTNADAGFGEWALSDGSGDLRADIGFDAIGAGLVALGNELQVTGADYSLAITRCNLVTLQTFCSMAAPTRPLPIMIPLPQLKRQLRHRRR